MERQAKVDKRGGEEKGTNGIVLFPSDDRRSVSHCDREARVGYIYSCTDHCIGVQGRAEANTLTRYNSKLDRHKLVSLQRKKSI
jgi:hypothetical protein